MGKQQSYNNHTTIVNNKKPMKHTNETRQGNTRMKKNINTAMSLNNEKQQPYNNETNNKNQE